MDDTIALVSLYFLRNGGPSMPDAEQTTQDKPLVTVYTAGHCTPCEEIKDLLGKGQFLVDGKEESIDVIDIETDEGFEQAQKMELTAVPQASVKAKRARSKLTTRLTPF
jgi:thiol-disulfide isomerase/thioredoxin